MLFLPRMVMKLLGLNRGRSDGGRDCEVQPVQ
jgi:hypothetical protein